MDSNRSYRIRTEVGQNSPNVLNVKMDNSFDILEILSLKLDQENLYHLPKSNYGVIVGRVIANKGFGVPNAKISVFIPKENNEELTSLYSYTSPFSKGEDGVRYNLLPSMVNEECHQDVGTFFTKKELLDNSTVIEIFEKYYRFTTTTNNSGDFLLSGVPTGMQQVHMDLDMSDCGVLSQTPRDMIYKGYNINQFESNVQFKKSTNLNNLAQIFTQNKSIYVYPFWGDTTDEDTNTSITRCDIEIDYEFEPTCIFMGSVVTDTAEASLSRKCQPDVSLGKMSNMVTGEGTIEMIRRTPDGKVEEYSVKGEKLIDGNGVWCYQIPMNLDYVTTDEFGNLVASDNPNKGIATRTRVRFRISMMDIEGDAIARKRAKYLVPNNPIDGSEHNPVFNRTHEFDYEFGTHTEDENFRDLYWNKVYTVKSYIPRVQKKSSPDKKNYTAIKAVNHYGDNNPMPYNNIQIKFNFMYRFVCTLIRFLLILISVLNAILSPFALILFKTGQILHFVGSIFKRNNNICKNIPPYNSSDGIQDNETTDDDDDKKATLRTAGCLLMHAALNLGVPFKNDLCEEIGGYEVDFYPGISDKFYQLKMAAKPDDIYIKRTKFRAIDDGIIKKIGDLNDTKRRRWGFCCAESAGDNPGTPRKYLDFEGNDMYTDLSGIMNCIENSLATENEVISFNFHNDWVNGVLYFPLWMRTIKQKKNGKVKDTYCNYNFPKNNNYKLKIHHPCAPSWTTNGHYNNLSELPQENNENVKLKVEKNTRIGLGYFSESADASNEANGFRFKSHRKTVGIMKINKGLIVEKETKLGQHVYYYSCGEYFSGGGKFYTQEPSEVKLFATDIVLLGSLDKCDPDGIPQFFEQLPSTTYNMPPALLTLDYETDDSVTKDSNSSDDIANVIEEGINTKTIHTEYTGADWGDASLDIFYRNNWGDAVDKSWFNFLNIYPPSPTGLANSVDKYSIGNIVGRLKDIMNNTNPQEQVQPISIPIVPGGEKYDRGGLFYGITCNTSYVKPKSCINLIRQCEFGVTLDQSKNLPNRDDDSDEGYLLLPDGFISYDEITNHDGRSMFATMNYDLLRYKIDEKTGYKKVDFRHKYIDNFDGTLHKLMGQYGAYPSGSVLSPDKDNRNYIDNKNLEQRNEDYVNFRYQGAPYHYKVNGTFLGTTHSVNYRIPRYRNSFYFYFGLKEGKTAIDRLRSEYYGTCETRNNPMYSIIPEYIPNSWCFDRTNSADGYFALSIKDIALPYSVEFENLDSSNPDDSFTLTDLYDDKIYMSRQSRTDLEGAGYVRLLDEESTPYVLNNDHYIVTVIDAEGIINDFDLIYMPSSITGDVSAVGFNKTNEELYETGIRYCDVAEEVSERIVNNMTIRERIIGGYIHINNLSAENSTSYRIKLTPSNPLDFPSEGALGTYVGYEDILSTDTSYDWRHNYIHDGCGLMYYNHDTHNFAVTVPKGGVNYDIEITMLCERGGVWEETNNRLQMTIFVPEGSDSRMIINDVDYRLISEFKAGVNSSGDFLGIHDIKGWTDIDNLSFEYDNADGYNYNTDNPHNIFGYYTKSGIVRTKLIHEVSIEDSSSTINEQINLLSTSKVTGSVSPYLWPKEYRVSITDFPISINTYDHIPTLSEAQDITDGYIYYTYTLSQYSQCNEPSNYRFSENNTYPNIASMQTRRGTNYAYCRVGEENNYIYFQFTSMQITNLYERIDSALWPSDPGDPIYTITNPPVSDYRDYANFDYGLYYDGMNIGSKQEWVDIINNTIRKRQEVVVKMKDAFWIQDYDPESEDINDGNSLNVRPDGYDTPYFKAIKYSNYMDDGNVISPLQQTYQSTPDTKGNIWYPLITYNANNDVVWNNKYPFAVGMQCGNGTKIPPTIGVNTGIGTTNMSEILTQFFNLQYIDKRFGFNSVCWAMTEENSGNDYYKIWDYDARPSSEPYPITKNPIFAIAIENGIINGDVESDGSVEFIEQNLSWQNIPYPIKIYNFKHSEGVYDTEMRMPTRRTTMVDWNSSIVENANRSYDNNNNPTLNNYRVWDDNVRDLQAMVLSRYSITYWMNFTHHYMGVEETINDFLVPDMKVKMDGSLLIKHYQVDYNYNTDDVRSMNDLTDCVITPSINTNRSTTFYLMLHEYDYVRDETNNEDPNKDKYCTKHPYIDHYKHFNESNCKYDDNFTSNDYFGKVMKPQNHFIYMEQRNGFWYTDSQSGVIVENDNEVTIVENGISADANIKDPLILASCTNNENFDLKEIFGHDNYNATFSLPGSSSGALSYRVCSSSLMYIIAKDDGGNTFAASPLIDMIDWQAQLVIYNGIEDSNASNNWNSWRIDPTLKKIVLRIHRPSKTKEVNGSNIPSDTNGNSLRYYYPFTKRITISPSKDDTQYYFTVDPNQCSKQFINRDVNDVPRWWEITLYEDDVYTSEGIIFEDGITMEDIVDKWKDDYQTSGNQKCNIYFRDIVGVAHYCEYLYVRTSMYHTNTNGSGSWDGLPVTNRMWTDTIQNIFDDGSTKAISEKYTITVESNDNTMGSVSIRSYNEPPFDDPSTPYSGTSGTFITNTLVEIEATPNSGCHFVSWNDNGYYKDRLIRYINLADNVTLTAIFAPGIS